MNAVISGAAGVALILDSGQSCILRVEAMDEPMPIRVEDQRYWFGDARDFQFLQGVTIPEIRRRLAEARDHDDALHLVLGLLDPELTDETRRALASELEDLLQVESVRTFLENVLHAGPRTPETDIEGAIRICNEVGAERAMSLQARNKLKHEENQQGGGEDGEGREEKRG